MELLFRKNENPLLVSYGHHWRISVVSLACPMSGMQLLVRPFLNRRMHPPPIEESSCSGSHAVVASNPSCQLSRSFLSTASRKCIVLPDNFLQPPVGVLMADPGASNGARSAVSESALISKKPRRAGGYSGLNARNGSRGSGRKVVPRMLKPCTSCRFHCSLKISEECRAKLHSSFWKGTFADRRHFLNKHVTEHPCKGQNHSRRIPLGLRSRRHSREYYLKDDESKFTRVCKTMFLHTLGKSTDGFLTNFFRGLTKSVEDTVFADHRGGDRKSHSWNVPEVIAHIQSFHPQISHYTRSHAPLRRYLEPSLSIGKMHRDFASNYRFSNVSYETYRKIFVKQRITFGHPAADLCDHCIWGKRHLSYPHTSTSDQCLECAKLALHEKSVAISRAEYRRDKNEDAAPGTGVYSVDMQKVLLLPVMRGKEYFFISRLVCFNETFANLRSGNDICVMWHEAISGRNGADVSSAFAKFILGAAERIENFVLWADNCAPQNKNWILFSTFLMLVNMPHGPHSIVIKYLEPGHTFMKADSVHGCIGRKLREEPLLYDFDDLNQLIRTAKSDLEVTELNASDILPLLNIRGNTKGLPKLRSLKAVRFERGSGSIFYKRTFDASAYLDRKFMGIADIPTLPISANSLRGINPRKKSEIIKTLVPAMPEDKQCFWKNIAVNEVADLCSDMH